MKMIHYLALLSVLLLIGVAFLYQSKSPSPLDFIRTGSRDTAPLPTPTLHPLSIEALRARSYDAEAPCIEQTLVTDAAYTKYLVSYLSDGLKIYGVMAVPAGEVPSGGWPIIMLNHGFITPKEYDNTAKYVAYIDMMARAGFVTFMSDYRGHGESEGVAEGGYFAPGYAIDVMHGIKAVQKMSEVNPNKLFLWGHSMGGNVSMRVRAIEPAVKATVIWAGVVGSYPMIYREFFNRPRTTEGTPEQRQRWSSSRQTMIRQYGTPSASLPYWNSIDPMTFISETRTPIQIHHGEVDGTVPVAVGKLFAAELVKAKVPHELHLYPFEDHNINGASFGIAMSRAIEFFRAQMK